MGSADGHCGLVDHHGPRFQCRADGSCRRLHGGQVNRAVRSVRGGYAEDDDLSTGHGICHIVGESKATGGLPLGDQIAQPGLNGPDFASGEPSHLVGIDVGAHHVVAQVGEARPAGQADVARADDRDRGHCGESRSVGAEPRRVPSRSALGRGGDSRHAEVV